LAVVSVIAIERVSSLLGVYGRCVLVIRRSSLSISITSASPSITSKSVSRPSCSVSRSEAVATAATRVEACESNGYKDEANNEEAKENPATPAVPVVIAIIIKFIRAGVEAVTLAATARN